MARIRTIKPEFFLSEQVGSVSFAARLLFAGLWTIADREGRLRWQPKRIKAQVFPHDEIELHRLAEELVTAVPEHGNGAPLVVFYADEGGVYAWIPEFVKHQRPHPKEPASVLPPCPIGADHGWLPWNATASREKVAEHPVETRVVARGKGREGDLGREGDQPPPQPLRGPGLIRSPLEFDRALQRCAFVGARLEVPNKLHADLVRDTGGTDTDGRLRAWYGQVDAEIERTREPIAPDVWKWLTARWRSWVAATAAAAKPSSSGVPSVEETREMIRRAEARAQS